MIGIGGAPEQPQSCAFDSGGACTSAPTRSKFGRGADSSAASAERDSPLLLAVVVEEIAGPI